METISALREAVTRSPEPDVALFQLGLALDRRGETADALAALRAAAVANPGQAQYQLAIGHLLARTSAHEEAVESCARALALDPNEWKAATLLGWLYGIALDRPVEARPFAARAIELNPDRPPAYVHLCRAWLDGESVETLRARVEAACPPRGRRDLLHAGLSTALTQVGRYEEVCRFLRGLVADEPANALLFATLGSAESVLGDEEAARAHLERAYQLDPSDEFVRNIYMSEAWQMRDAGRIRAAMPDGRTSRPSWSRDRDATSGAPPPPDGGVAGRTVLLKEMPNGYGDTVQCARRAWILEARGARVILEGRRPLRSLLETVSGAAGVVVPHDEYPPIDDVYYPFQFPPTLDWTWDDLSHVPYLHIPDAGRRAWSARLRASRGGVHVGVEWRTGDDLTHRDNPYRRRMIPLEQLRPLLARPGTAWHALDFGQAGRRDIAALPGLPLNDLAEALPDFLDTAAAISALDLVVTVDTAVAHIAGALGKPTFLLLPYHADWRWGRQGSTVRWYPSIQAFRQPAPGAWGPVVAEVEEALHTIVRSHELQGTADV